MNTVQRTKPFVRKGSAVEWKETAKGIEKERNALGIVKKQRACLEAAATVIRTIWRRQFPVAFLLKSQNRISAKNTHRKWLTIWFACMERKMIGISALCGVIA